VISQNPSSEPFHAVSVSQCFGSPQKPRAVEASFRARVQRFGWAADQQADRVVHLLSRVRGPWPQPDMSVAALNVRVASVDSRDMSRILIIVAVLVAAPDVSS
jgi:hypothetical protein